MTRGTSAVRPPMLASPANGGLANADHLDGGGGADRAAALAQTPSVQQRFDAARIKLEARDNAGALAELEALEAHLTSLPKVNLTNLAITKAQQAQEVVRLGRIDESKRAARAALAGDALAKPGVRPVRDNARLNLASILEAELDHADAAAEYQRIVAESDDPMMRTVALMGAARAQMFTDPDAALRQIGAALALAESDPAISKKELANVFGLKGRILLNGGQDAEARVALERAVQLRGGLGHRVTQADLSLRADAAIAMLRLGNEEQARKYLAYTGAGRTQTQLEPPVDMPLPACGDDGIDPQDSAVIEFSILGDGRVIAARPIFSSKRGEAAYVFARAVEGWSWEPDNAGKVDPFFRFATRVELRCTNRLVRPGVTAEFEAAMEDWLAIKGVKPPTAEADADRLLELKPRLAAAPAESPERLSALIGLAQAATLERTERLAHAEEATRLAGRIGAPAAARFFIALQHASIWSSGKGSSQRARP